MARTPRDRHCAGDDGDGEKPRAKRHQAPCETTDGARIKQHGRRLRRLLPRFRARLVERFVAVGAARRPQRVTCWSKSRSPELRSRTLTPSLITMAAANTWLLVLAAPIDRVILICRKFREAGTWCISAHPARVRSARWTVRSAPVTNRAGAVLCRWNRTEVCGHE